MQATTFPHDHAAPPAPWYRHRWPWLLMLGPALVLVGGFFTLWLALSRPDALVVDDYYKQGKAINQDLRRDRNAATLGMYAALAYNPAGGKLQGRVLAARDAPFEGSLRIRLLHSTQPEKDMLFHVHTAADGGFAIALPVLEKARWQVLIEDEREGWRLNGEWIWPMEQTLELKPLEQKPELRPADA